MPLFYVYDYIEIFFLSTTFFSFFFSLGGFQHFFFALRLVIGVFVARLQ